MKKGQIVEGYVEQVDFPNKGIVRVEEQKETEENRKYRVEVKGVLPGQTIRLSVKKAGKHRCQGILREVLNPSALETAAPECPHFGACGGCSYQTLPYIEQLRLKKQQVLRLIQPVCEGISSFSYDGIIASPSPWEYRNKMEFTFGDEVKDGPLMLGMHKKGSFHDIVHASGCRIVHKDYHLVLDCIRDYCAGQKMTFYKRNSHEGLLRHLLVRRAQSTGEMLVALVTSSQYREEIFDRQMEELAEKLQELPLEGTLVGFLHVVNDSLGDVVKSDRTRLIVGRDWFTEEMLGLKFRISLFSFFQTNTFGAERLYRRVREYVLNMGQDTDIPDVYFVGEGTDDPPDPACEDLALQEDASAGSQMLPVQGKACSRGDFAPLQGKLVFDLYSGTGTIAQMLAPVAGRVIGVEIVEEAVEVARQNAALNGLENCEFIAGDVLKVLDEIEEKPDYIILDPPRDGIHPKALRKIVGYGVDRIVYISCKPTSLARDLVVLQENGYRVERMSNVDLFANGVHVESIVLLSHKSSDSISM